MEQHDNPPKKHVKSKKSKPATPPLSTEPLDMDSIVEVDPTPSIDVSNHQYTLPMHCFLGANEYSSNTEFLKLGEWNWQQWKAQCIWKLQKAGDEGGFDTEWVTSHATIKAHSIIKADMLGFDVEDDQGWRKVERFIELWMKAGKCDILVNLSSTWCKKGGSNSLNNDCSGAFKTHGQCQC